MKGSPVFLNELSYLWGSLIDVNFERPTEAVQYYIAICALSRYQASLKVRPNVLMLVYKEILQPLQAQIADLVELLRLTNCTASNMEKKPTYVSVQNQIQKEVDSSALPLLQFVVSDTINTVQRYLFDAGYL